MLVALVLIPGLLGTLGPQRFGLLALIWAVANYFGMFDLGLSRVLTQRVARLLPEGRLVEAGSQAATVLALLGGLGFLAALILHIAAPHLVGRIADVGAPVEAIAALRWLSWGLPCFMLTAGLRGLLEAAHAFGTLNLIRLPVGVWTFLGPWWVVSAWGPDLILVTQALVAGRLAGFVAHAFAVSRVLPGLRIRLPQRDGLGELIASSGWLTLGSLVNPIAAYLDRFVVGVLMSASAVSHYVTPQELVTKLAILPTALASALLPRAAEQLAGSRPDRRLFGRAVAAVLLALLPLTLGLGLVAGPALEAWLGSAFAASSVPVLQVLCLGVLANGLAYVPLTWLHAAGDFRTPALVQSVALAGFAVLLWLLCSRYGLVGAAWAWTLRMCGDSAALFWLYQRGIKGEPR